MLLILLIFLFIAGSVAIISFQVFPILTSKLEQYQLKRAEYTAQKLEGMFYEVKREKLFYIYIFVPIIGGVLGYFLFRNVISVIFGFIFGFILPSLVVMQMENNRKKKFHQQLMEALLILSGALKSGLSFIQALAVVVEEMPKPISEEFRIVLNETKVGIPLEEALERLNKRMYSEDLNMFVTAVLVNRETGGDLSKIFEHLVYSLRQKNKILNQVITLTLQARWQGMIMMGLPILFAGFVIHSDPKFFDIMLNNDLGRALLLYALISQIVGMFLIRRLSRVEV